MANPQAPRNRAAKALPFLLLCAALVGSLLVTLPFVKQRSKETPIPGRRVLRHASFPIKTPKAPALGEKQREKIGLAAAGGCYTAANIHGAIMRGFQQHTVKIDGEDRPAMERLDYLGGLSGGNFANLVYAFAQNKDSDTVLDASGISDPTLITTEELETTPKDSMFALFIKSVWGFDFDQLPAALLWSFLHNENFWTSFVYLRHFAPFGIPRNKYFSQDDEGSDDYISPRSEVKATPAVEFSMTGPPEVYPDWLYNVATGTTHEHLIEAMKEKLPKAEQAIHDLFPGVDFRIMNNSLIEEELEKVHNQIPIPFSATPEDIGTTFGPATMKFDDESAEPLDLPVPDVDPKEWSSTSRRFSLESLLAVGTGLIPLLGDEFFEPLKALPSFVSDKIQQPLTYEVPTASGEKRVLTFADGGFNTAHGIHSLLEKGVKKIISSTSITPATFGYDPSSVDAPFLAMQNYADYFGLTIMDYTYPGVYSSSTFTAHVFDLYSNGENQLIKLAATLWSLQDAGEPMITTLKNLTLVDNKFWGTKAGDKVDLTVIHNVGVPKKFSDLVPRDVAPPPEGKDFTENGFFTNEDLAFVPNVRWLSETTFMNTTLPEFSLQPKAARMTQFLCSWMVKRAWNGLKGSDGKVKFEGFKNLLEGSDVSDESLESLLDG